MSDDRARVCVLGSINMDLIVGAPRLPAPGQTLMGGPFEMWPGGKGANQAVAAARMGAAVNIVGRVGDDAHGAAMVAALRENGVDTTAVTSVAGLPTGVALITVAGGGENTIVVSPGANSALSDADVEVARHAIAHADVLLMQLEVPIAAALRAAAIARESGVTVILNAAPAMRLPDELLLNTDVLVVNENEGAAVAGMNSPAPRGGVLSRLASLGPGTVVMTLGAAGAIHARGNAPARTSGAFAVAAVDTVGAGDAFCGAFAVRWAEHQVGGAAADEMMMLDVMAWATAAGALATMRAGAIPSLPTRREVAELLKGKAS